MTSRTRRAIPAIAASTLFVGASIASAAEPTQQELLAQIEQLKSKVEAMESKQLNTADVDATVDSVLRDAERRSQLLAVDGVGGGYDSKDGFHLKDASGANKLRVGFQFQYRNVTTYLDDDGLGGQDEEDMQNGMEIRRLKTSFTGNAISTALKYNFTVAYNRNGGGATLETAMINYAVDEGWGFQVGQFKDLTYKEESISSSRQMAVDRSLANELIGGGITDYIQAVAAYYGNVDGMMLWVGLSDGVNSDNTDWQDEPPSRSDYGVLARVDWTLSGKGKSGADFTAMGNDEDYLGVGAGGHWSQAPEENTLFHSADIQWENASGLSLFGAYYGTWIGVNDDDNDSYNWGVMGQIGQMLSENWEIFGQGSWVDVDGLDDQYWQLVAGVNYYLDGHTKVTVDLGVLPDGAPGGLDGIGVLPSNDMEIVIRGQFQLLR